MILSMIALALGFTLLGLISTNDNLVAAMVSGQQRFPIWKSQTFVTVAGRLYSLWTVTSLPASGVAPTAAANPTSSTLGGIPYTAASGSNTMQLLAFSAICAVNPGGVLLYDRVGHQAGLSGTAAGAQTTNLPVTCGSRPDTTGKGVEGWLEIYTALGATPRTATCSYTDASLGAGQTSGSITIPASVVAGTLLPIPLAAGGTGIKSVESVTFSGSTGTAGNLGVTLGKRITDLWLAATAVGVRQNLADIGMPTITASTCFWLVVMAATTSFGDVYGEVALVEG